MTEIPEHLLKRSRERRAAIGKGGDGAEGDSAPETSAESSSTPAAQPSTPATQAASPPAGPPARTPAPEPAAPPPPKPDPPYVKAARRRKKIPFWAMATLSLLPVWAFIYMRSVTESPEVAEGPLAIGEEMYGSCASCHGGEGGGVQGLGYAFAGGEVLLSYPLIEDQIRYVYYGTEGYNAEGVEIPGNPDRPGGPHVTGAQGVMPAFAGGMTQYEIIGVVCHERYTLGGADPTSEEFADEFELWCSEDAPVFEAVQAGTYDYTEESLGEMADFPITPVGPVPIPGSP